MVKIPEFILVGLIRGNLIRFLYPGLHLVQGQQQFKNILVSFLIAGTMAFLFVIFRQWFKDRGTRWDRFKNLLIYSILASTGYLAASLGRASGGIEAAGIARYTYQSFFFLIILTCILLKDFPKKIKIGIFVGLIFWTLNLYALINFENSFWKIMSHRDRQFVQDISYLFNHNSSVYNLTVPGIHPEITLSKLWFLFPGNHTLEFINSTEQPKNLNAIQADSHSKEIYQRIEGDYQNKFD